MRPTLPLHLPPVDPSVRIRARGTPSRPAGRFEPYEQVIEEDGWDSPVETRPLRTEVMLERMRKVITRNDSPDIPFDRSVNPYRGCEHGCVYCFARPSHAYLGLSPGLDFETRLVARPDAPELLRKELSRKGYAMAPMAIGTNTDPYQPIEAEHRVMRGLLEVLSEFNHPVTITTRGALILRDIDILSDMAARGLVHVGVSVTTLDQDLARAMEPRAPAPAKRIHMIRELSREGVPVRVMAAPMIPGLTDHELEAILTEARRAGAKSAAFLMLRLPHEVAPLFADWLARERPLRAERVLEEIAEMRAGAGATTGEAEGKRLNDPRFGTRMTGEGVKAELLAQRFAVSCRRLGYARDLPAMDLSRFAVPLRRGDQLALF